MPGQWCVGKYTVYWDEEEGCVAWVQKNESLFVDNTGDTDVIGRIMPSRFGHGLPDVSGWNLRSAQFFRHFDSKEDLLKAYLEEQAVIEAVTD